MRSTWPLVNNRPADLDFASGEQAGWLIDPLTLATAEPGVFAGGGIRRENRSPIESIAGGKRAAVSIDRYLQKVSLTASRTGEGAVETRLFVNMEGIEPLPVTPMADEKGYSVQEAVLEARRCIQCQCLECVKVCEYLNSFRGYPKKYIRQIYNNLSIVMGHRHANKLINSCSLCGLCREVCPEDLHMGLVCKKAREIMVNQGQNAPVGPRVSNPGHDSLAMVKNASWRGHQPGCKMSDSFFFPGCQLSASAPEHVEKHLRSLCDKLQGGVGLMLRCCGAPAEWSGRAELFSESFRDIG